MLLHQFILGLRGILLFFSLTKSKFTAHFVILTTVANLVVLGLSQNSVHHAVLSTCTVCTLTLIQ